MGWHELNKAAIRDATGWEDSGAVLDKHGLTPDYVFGRLRELMDSRKESTVLKAIEIWGRFSGYMPPERMTVSGFNNLQLRIVDPGDGDE